MRNNPSLCSITACRIATKEISHMRNASDGLAISR